MTESMLVEGVPAHLETPTVSSVQPPVQTLEHVLPCDLLRWEDFERLCVRLVRSDSDIERARMYGIRGQAQEGIDLYARSFQGKYRVYQCKRVEEFRAAEIRGAVEKFLAGDWSTRATQFIICTSASSVRTQETEEYERQHQILRAKSITFDIWDREEISGMLRGQHLLVHDFFGKAWLRAFLGEDAVKAIAQRLEPEKVGEFRKELRIFYHEVFSKQDPGIPIPPKAGLAGIPLVDRFVPQDILVNERSSLPARPKDEGSQSPETYVGSPPRQETHESQIPPKPVFYPTREGLSQWLARSKNSLITGGPGAGKSSLLRYIALEILSDTLKEKRIATTQGEALPVYVPFAFWTKQILETGTCSLTECIRVWLRSWSEEHLWNLVRDALEDERVLLLVDGIDESANEASGRVALQMLQVFVQTHGIAAIVTTRPNFGMTVHGEEWQSGELAGLSDLQRADLCAKWFRIRNEVQTEFGSPKASSEFVARDTQLFLQELSDSADLEDLSRVPLLLLLLIYLRFKNAVLPRDRFQAYSNLIDYLVAEHPRARRAASQLVDGGSLLRDREIFRILGKIAFDIQESTPGGTIDSNDLIVSVESFLNDSNGLDLGLAPNELRRFAEEFNRIVQGGSGILVRLGEHSVSFLHRSLQEHLAATYIAQMPIPDVIRTLEAHVGDNQWREVILSLLWKIQRPAEVAQLTAKLEELSTDPQKQLFVREILTQVACSDIGCPTDLARRLVSEAIDLVETSEWLPHRRRLIQHLSGGLIGSKTNEIVRGAFARWAFRPGLWRPSWYEAIGGWTLSSDAIRALTTALNDEDESVQRVAAENIAKMAAGDEATGNVISQLAKKSLDSSHRAAALRALGFGWKHHESLIDLVNDAVRSRSIALQVTAILLKVKMGVHLDEDFEHLFRLANAGWPNSLLWGWKSEVIWSFVNGWKGSAKLRELCIQAVEHHGPSAVHLDRDVALGVLVQAFPQDDEVAQYFAHLLESDQFHFWINSANAWRFLSINFRNHPVLVKAIDLWGPRQNEGRAPELRYAAVIGRTAKMKQKLLDRLSTGSIQFWAADGLIEGWGLEDPEVNLALRTAIFKDSRSASELATHIPSLLSKSSEARARLLELLQEPNCRYPNLVVRALASLTDRGDEDEIVRTALQIRTGLVERSDELLDADLIEGFFKHPSVRALAFNLCSARNPPVEALAKAFSNDEEIRRKVLDLIVSIPSSLRAEVIAGLSRVTANAEFSLSVLQRYDNERDGETKTIGSIAFHRLLLRKGMDLTDVLRQLSETICAYGIDHELRRQAAFAGLLVLNRLDLMQQMEKIGGGPVSVRFESIGQPNITLLRLIAEHWNQLVDTFGASLPERLGDRFAITKLPEAIATVATQFPGLQEVALGSDEPDVKRSPAILKLLNFVGPKSELLRHRCLGIIGEYAGTWGEVHLANTAAGILAENFGGDKDVRNQIIREKMADELTEGEVIALCAGWPDDPFIDELKELLRERRLNISPYAAESIQYSQLPATVFVSHLSKDLDRPEISNEWMYLALRGPVERRVKRDSMVREEMYSRLRVGATPSGKLTFMKLIASAGGVTDDLLDWARDELNHQLTSGIVPEIGFDLVEGAARAVAVSLMDILNP